MRAMCGNENNENNKRHDSEHERSMNVSKGSRGGALDFRQPGVREGWIW